MVTAFRRPAVGIFLGATAMLAAATLCSFDAGRLEGELRNEVKSSIDRGLRYLRFKQEKDGCWNHELETTALVVRAFMESPRRYNEEDGPFVRKPLEYVASRTKATGAIDGDEDLVRSTSLAVRALKVSQNSRHDPVVEKAETFLLASILEGLEGGVTTETQNQFDLETLLFSLEALKALGVPGDHKVWATAVETLARFPLCEQPYLVMHGLLLSNVGKEDPRLHSAFLSVREQESSNEGPGTGTEPPYRDYYFLISALDAYGEPFLVDADGKKYKWREELARELLELQQFPGQWEARSSPPQQGGSILPTCFAILALERLYNSG